MVCDLRNHRAACRKIVRCPCEQRTNDIAGRIETRHSQSKSRRENRGFEFSGAALEVTAQDSFVVITGSLYLVGEALELLQVYNRGTTNERGLNEWSVTQ